MEDGAAVAKAIAHDESRDEDVDDGDAMEVDGGDGHDEALIVRAGTHSPAYLLLLEHALVRYACTQDPVPAACCFVFLGPL